MAGSPKYAREVGKEYREFNVAIIMAALAYVTAAAVFAAGLNIGDSSLMIGAGVMAAFGVGSNVLYAKGGGSHYTVLAHQKDHLGNPMLKVQYRHGEVALIP